LVVVHDHRSRRPAKWIYLLTTRGLFLATSEDFDMAMDSASLRRQGQDMTWKIELCFESDDDGADEISDAVHSFLIDHLEKLPDDVPWAMITTLGMGERESRRWKPLLHSSRRQGFDGSA